MLGNFLDNKIDKLKSQAQSLLDGAVPTAQGAPTLSNPWDRANRDEVFFPPNVIEGDRWSGVYPYRLLVVDAVRNAVISSSGGVPSPGEGAADFIYYPVGGDPVAVKGNYGRWEYELPITPQMINIGTSFAIANTPTLRGVLEEHGGVRYKPITIKASTGVWRDRPSLDSGNTESPGILQSFFANTIEQAGRLADTFRAFTNIASGNHPKAQNAINYAMTEEGLNQTGYYKALQLEQFLEQYAIAKKDPSARDWRLVLDMPKLNQSYVVTPAAFAITKSSERPNEHVVTLQLRAWKRINLSAAGQEAESVVPQLEDPGFLQRALSTIKGARAALADAKDLVRAVKGDVTAPFEVLRQGTLFIKDLAGVAASVADLPNSIVRSFQDAWQDALSNLKKAELTFETIGGGTGLSDGERGVVDAVKSIKTLKEGQPFSAGQSTNPEVLSQNAGASDADLDPSVGSALQDPDRYYRVLDLVNVGDLNLPDDGLEAVDDEVGRVRDTTVDDIRGWTSTIKGLTESLSDSFGDLGEEYTTLMGLPEPKTRSVDISLDEYELLTTLYEATQVFETLTSTRYVDDRRSERQRQETLDNVGGAPDVRDQALADARSKILAPVPYGLTLEEISARYLGDPDRWGEIAELNGLREPYIDEEGFTRSLTSNAESRSFNVSSVDDMYVGQKVTLGSSAVLPFVRRVVDMEEVGDDSYLVTVDGEPTLSQLTTAQGAYMKAYLPGTVNSQNQVYIPSDREAQDDRTFMPFQYKDSRLAKIAKVDFLLGPDYDVVFTQGDFNLATGVTNLDQAFRLKLVTAKNRILRHPGFGAGVRPGVSSADFDLAGTVRDLEDMIADDPRYDGFVRVQLAQTGPALAGRFRVRIANGLGILPLDHALE